MAEIDMIEILHPWINLKLYVIVIHIKRHEETPQIYRN